MNCWIILLLLLCCGRNSSSFAGNISCGCDCHDHHEACDNSFIQPRMWERDNSNVRCEREDYYDDGHDHDHDHDDCGCSGEDRVRDKWMPYKEYNDNDRTDCNCK